ncbi:MAG: SDR family NAD(P)-dependent oxidoreductase [Bacteroidales bacterium]|nr:SDR family NAD(P)-dependent oxidoreductase [Bacteroidales bacterium]MDZ4204369.1 SDR family NAD(P)-dependent oxidoreductase [Bacteroidales bacterium]
MSPQKFQGKVAVITGSSRGIGKAIALELARNGAHIVLNGRNQAWLIETENEIRKIHDHVVSVCCDVSTIHGGQLLISEAINSFSKIDILVNNVGVSMRGNVADLNPEVFKTVFESNVLGAVNPTIPALKHLRNTKGSIIFISSLAGIRGLPGLSAYCSSKMALRALAETIRIEEAKHKLHVGLVFVGFTKNENNKESIAADGSKIILEPRTGRGVQTLEAVAAAVVRNISKRKFVTVLTALGKLNAFIQPRFPFLVEWLILRNLKKFEERSR